MKNESIRKVINVDKPNYSPVWNFKQEDDGVLKLALFKGSTLLDITGQTIKLGAKRPNNSIVELTDGFKINKNELDITLKNNILAVPGIVECDLEIIDASGKMTTTSFYLSVSQKMTGENNLNASNDISAINKLVEDIKKKGKDIDTVINDVKPKSDKLMSDIKKDYDSLHKIIIDENQAANLQDQVNKTNAQLETIETNSATKLEVDVERKRINNLTKLGEGSTTGDAELIDARVQTDGVVAENVGEAVRNQISSIKEDFGNYLPITWIENNFIHSWGTVVESDSYDCTDFISYSSKLQYKIRTKMENDLSRIAYYDNTKKMIKSVNLYSSTLKEFDVEQIENCAYIRFSFYKGRNKTDSNTLCYCKVVSIFDIVNSNIKKITQLENEIKDFKFWSYAISKVILIGDSLTSGAYPTEDWGADASPNDSIAQNIPYYLKRMLNLDSVVNAGKSGFSASDWYISRIQNQPQLYDFSKFDSAIIWLGTNNGLTDTINTEGTEANYYKKIIDRIKEQNPNCFIILVKVFASKGDVATTNAIIDKLATLYNCMVINNSDLTVANYPQLHVNNETNNPHFGKAGNIFVANRYACEISKYLNESPIRCEFGITKRTD